MEAQLRQIIPALLGATALSIACAHGALAADMPAKAPLAAPAYGWTGFYIGGDVGGLWSSNTGTWHLFSTPVVVNDISGSNGGSSFVGGLHAGYNWQFAPTWVAGIEGDWSWAHASGSTSQLWTLLGTATPVAGSLTNMSSTLNWVSSLRARLGYLVLPNLLAYGTGGVAWGKFDYAANANLGIYSTSATLSSTQAGYAAGGGLEWAMTKNWFLRGEYLYYRFNGAPSVVAQSAAVPTIPSGFAWSSTNLNVARAGLSYKF